MKSKKGYCLHRTGSPGSETAPAGRPVDSRTVEVFRQLRVNAEDLALELAVRLRVLGKTLAAACPGDGTAPDTSAYGRLRRQLDLFFSSLESRELAGERYFPAIRSYLQETLPPELESSGCIEPCRVELVDAVICLLAENGFEEDVFAEELAASYSL